MVDQFAQAFDGMRDAVPGFGLGFGLEEVG
jgi:hypothetical protein